MQYKTSFKHIVRRMCHEGLPQVAIDTFEHNYSQLVEGARGFVSHYEIEPLMIAPDYHALHASGLDELRPLKQTLMVKLNGGLGTSMGLAQAKLLLPAKDGCTFLDIIAKQVLYLRKTYGVDMPLVFMNSFNTDEDTLKAMDQYPELVQGQKNIPLSFLQHKVPKIDQDTFEAVEHPEDPSKEWCPPGHGDIYTAMVSSGILRQFLEQGFKYAFVSNADNLGAVMDPRILAYFVERKIPFLMEVTDRTEADKKGGHLARNKNGGILLRELAQCPEDEIEDFQDVSKFKYFNTNTIWVNLESIQQKLSETHNVLKLPLIVNSKTIDPKDTTSLNVFHLEMAMGAAISTFPDAEVLRVPRTRFTPVKTTNDLLALWSDIFVLNEAGHVVVNPRRKLETIVIDLDGTHYKLIEDFQARLPVAAPSLLKCSSLAIQGDIRFGPDVQLKGNVHLRNDANEQRVIANECIDGSV
ncbi:MAG: UTP--glucose-1-phosphate uridylyltransferase [Kiritimatiellae bacterium]|nr:UTP--glucose-1-phosphate uridylyltransferase [Kiritimatiellia bacterium]